MRVQEIGIPPYNESYSIIKWSMSRLTANRLIILLPSMYCRVPIMKEGGMGPREKVYENDFRLEIPQRYLLITNGYTV